MLSALLAFKWFGAWRNSERLISRFPLLPEYRGAAPINWAIINGETKTGVTTFFIDDKVLDTGAMILNDEIEIGENETAGELHDRLMVLGVNARKTLALIEKGNVSATLQSENPEIKTAYKLNRENCKIDWNKVRQENSQSGSRFKPLSGCVVLY